MIIIDDKNYYSSTSSIPLKLKHKRGDIRKLKKLSLKYSAGKYKKKKITAGKLLDIAAFQNKIFILSINESILIAIICL